MPTTKRPGTRMTRTAGSARLVLLVSTRKGAWLFHGDGARRSWRVDGPHFLGQVINHLVLDPRDGRTLLAAAKTGHLGPTVFRSTDLGRSWKEAKRPPAFAKAPESERGRAVDHTFWLTPGHASETGTARRTERRTDRSCTRSSSTRGIRRTCSWACRAAAFTGRETAEGRGHRW